MGGIDSTSFPVATTAIVITFLCTLPAVWSLISGGTSSKKLENDSVYADKDGSASKESDAAFSNILPKILIIVFSICGFAVAIATGVLGVLDLAKDGLFIENWIKVGIWSLILAQSFVILGSRAPVKSYDLGLFAMISYLFLIADLLLEEGLLAQRRSGIGPVPAFVLRILQIAFAALGGVSCVSIPRRPTVFYEGQPVDNGYTYSAIVRYSFSWCEAVLNLAAKNKSLNLTDLPSMDHLSRSKALSDTWEEAQRVGKLWKKILVAHKVAFVIQWILCLIQAFGNFAPQFVMLHILRILEMRDRGASIAAEAVIWVLALGLTTVITSWIEAWLFWVSWSELAIPVRAQMSALIFAKCMRRKDVKGAAKASKPKTPEEGIAAETSPPSGPKGESLADDKPEGEDEESDVSQKTRQSTVNLIGVDAKRLSDFCSLNFLFPGSLFKLIVSLAFLLDLIGWKALLAGFATMLFTMPVNIYFSRRYAAAQDRLMKVRDTKMGVVTEALQGIRQIKFSALENQWQAKIGRVRSKELSEQWRVFASDTMLLFCWIAGPILLAATALAVYAALNGNLTPSVAFTAIGVFRQLEVTLSVIPELTTDLIDAWVSTERIEKYLEAPEISVNSKNAPSISLENASIAWPSDEEKEDGDLRYVLRNVNVSFPENELSVISGKTGSGKSLLLAAILGEVDVLSGSINVPQAPSLSERHDDNANAGNWLIPSAIAFVAQIPWIENASIKDNIVFGLPLVEARYRQVIEVCALRKDLDMLTDGENTEIGANGINLSGGQRWRVTFARALYSRAGTLVLDDIFSAVDAHVGRHIFEQGLTGELGVGRTRILVTHHVALCKARAKYIVELGDGTIAHAGLLSELEERGVLQQIISHEQRKEEAKEDEEAATAVNSEESSDGEVVETMEPLKKVDSKAAAKKFVQDEKREQGSIKKAIYLDYLKISGGFPFWTFALIIFVCLQGITLGRSWWLRLWTGSYEEAKATSSSIYSYDLQMTTMMRANVTAGLPQAGNSLQFYLGIYVSISLIAAVVGTLRFFYIFTGSIRASRKLFDNLCFTILRTPLRWMDTVPLGRILNRFTTDFNVVDSRLANDISFGASAAFSLIGVIVAGLFVSPYVILLAFVLLTICLYFALRYLTAAREVKRIESNAKSPIFEQFGSALTGVGTIRAFDKTEVYIKRMYKKIDDHTKSFWHLWLFNRWLGYRMSMVGALFSTTIAMVIIGIKDIDASLAGFALAFALEYTSAVVWTIRHYTNMELNFNAAERIIEYSNLETESLHGAEPPAAWPSEGRLEVKNLTIGYAADLPAVLKNLTFSVERNERIGVVGRTGAGKSSLTLALFRFLEAREGSIFIDGIDISNIKLQSLRSRLAIIPQDPVLFSGTVRSNLDAFDDHEDTELHDALQRVHLVSGPESRDEPSAGGSGGGTSTPSPNTNTNPFRSLHSVISEGGLNLSQGQRQLLCLARAIVSRPKIMVLDEATSAVDMDTDLLIQRSIREEFGDATLVVIAHRLSTIADFDRILVLDAGEVREFGSPAELYAQPEGAFRKMVEESGEREKLVGIVTGKA